MHNSIMSEKNVHILLKNTLLLKNDNHHLRMQGCCKVSICKKKKKTRRFVKHDKMKPTKMRYVHEYEVNIL